jgi:midasin (ATPase involved in ribosome maturation)
VLGTELDANIKGFSNGAIYSMAFVGESGTGKSTAARVIPARCGIPYISVNFSVNIEEADLFGSMVPNAKKSKPEDPEFVWADGIITKAVRYGYCVILEELNFARPGVLGKLNSLLDENRQIDLSTGEIVKAHPNFRIIATCNIAYEGTNRFNKALINRFDDVTVFKDLPRNEAITVIKNRTGYSSTVKISKVYDVYEALKKFAAEQNVNAVVSMRQLLNVFTKGKYYSNAKDAVQRIIINGAFIEDSEYQKVFEDTVFSAFDLKFKI